ncbi:DUF3558 domain-containing protein [Nocardia sp. NBC_00565]|uniref:DUF3558 domain-containing protein n=1 Tax=Nocardia sp. NBC_00565 TaxID=2975993 RepID=UPI002E821848|nr:DUF3558 domain-containing protein [Nocardia sp. NBC_00565]WUC04300.1 DUF3558 domain-containing protein [Nocardia sp. NBC_00565]
MTAAVAVLAGVFVVATGCDSANGGTATTVSTTDKAAATAALWDPCTQISDETLRQVGVDPSTRGNTISGVENVEGWKLCSWHDKPSRWDYALGVWSTTHTIDESKKDENNVDFADISIAGREGVQFRRREDRNDEICYISFPSSGQAIDISVYKTVLTKDNRGPCVIAAAAAEILVPIFPK